MSVEHLSIRGGGAEFVSFARGRIRALKAAGLKYASRTFMVNGVSIKVRLVGNFEYIDVKSAPKVSGVAVLYESYDHYATGEFWEVPYDTETGIYEIQIGIVNVYLLAADGSRTYVGKGNYEWTPYGDNPYGYDGITPITALPPEPPAIAPDPPLPFPEPPRNEGVALCILGFSMDTYRTAIYATQEDADNYLNPIEIDHTQTLEGEVWKIHWAIRAMRAA